MRAACIVFAVLGLMVVLAAPAAGRDIFVDNAAGDDAFTGHNAAAAPNMAGPVRSLSRALDLAMTGDRILLANTGVPYRESVSLVGSRHSGSSLNWFLIVGNGAVLDGSAPVPTSAWEHVEGNVYRFQPPRLAHQQLFLNDVPVPLVVSDPLIDQPAKLDTLQWTLHRGHMYFAAEPLKRPEDYRLTYAALPVGITLYHVRRAGIVDLTVQGFQLDGISAFNSAVDVHLDRVVCRGNGRTGLTVGGASLVDVNESHLGDNGRAQILTQPWSTTHIHDSQLLPGTAPPIVRQGGEVMVDGRPLDEAPSRML